MSGQTLIGIYSYKKNTNNTDSSGDDLKSISYNSFSIRTNYIKVINKKLQIIQMKQCFILHVLFKRFLGLMTTTNMNSTL